MKTNAQTNIQLLSVAAVILLCFTDAPNPESASQTGRYNLTSRHTTATVYRRCASTFMQFFANHARKNTLLLPKYSL